MPHYTWPHSKSPPRSNPESSKMLPAHCVPLSPQSSLECGSMIPLWTGRHDFPPLFVGRIQKSEALPTFSSLCSLCSFAANVFPFSPLDSCTIKKSGGGGKHLFCASTTCTDFLFSFEAFGNPLRESLQPKNAILVKFLKLSALGGDRKTPAPRPLRSAIKPPKAPALMPSHSRRTYTASRWRCPNSTHYYPNTPMCWSQ